MKKIMILGGNSVQETVILAAKALGFYVITVDYCPDNPGHKFADEYHNVSVVDKQAVLELARSLKIDGICTYASDISVSTVSYVANALGLPANPPEACEILTHKDKFRALLREMQIQNVPQGRAFFAKEHTEARQFYDALGKTVAVKPVDSSGSKGVHRIEPGTPDAFEAAWADALSYSLSGRVIIEEFILRKGYQIDGDGFVVDGKIAIFGMMDQHQDAGCNPYVPVSLSYPSIQPDSHRDAARAIAQKIFDRVGFRFGAFNYEYIYNADGDIYILEIGPRNGGNLIPDVYEFATGASMAACTVLCALGLDCSAARKETKTGCYASYILHAQETGTYKGLEIDPFVKERIVLTRMNLKPGDPVHRFRNARDDVGSLALRFDSVEQMNETIEAMNRYIRVIVEP